MKATQSHVAVSFEEAEQKWKSADKMIPAESLDLMTLQAETSFVKAVIASPTEDVWNDT